MHSTISRCCDSKAAAALLLLLLAINAFAVSAQAAEITPSAISRRLLADPNSIGAAAAAATTDDSQRSLTRDTHFYRGQRCHDAKDVTFCAFPGSQCYKDDNCTMFAAGEYDWSKYTAAPAAAPPSRVCDGIDADDGAFDAATGRWSRASCGYVEYDARAAMQCLAGKRLLFTGDSMVRLFFF